eukprot:5123511-Prymnesium_polylepis.1
MLLTQAEQQEEQPSAEEEEEESSSSSSSSSSAELPKEELHSAAPFWRSAETRLRAPWPQPS